MSEAASELSKLHETLCQLVYLEESHGQKFSLEEFSEMSKQRVLCHMLDNVIAPELLFDEVEHHIKPCAEKYGLDLGSVLLQYIDEIVQDIDIKQRESLQEQRALYVCMCIPESDQKNRAKGLLCLVRNVMPPYTQDLQNLISETVNLGGEFSAEILEQKRLMDLRHIVSKHRHNDITMASRFRFVDYRDEKLLMQYIVAIAASSSSEDQVSELLQDALKLAKSYHRIDSIDVYVMYLQNVAELPYGKETSTEEEVRRKVDQVLQFGISAFSLQKQINACFHLLNFCEEMIQFMHSPKDAPTNVTFVAYLVSTHLINLLKISEDMDNQVAQLEWVEHFRSNMFSLYRLALEFNIFALPKQLEDENFNPQLLNDYLDNVSIEDFVTGEKILKHRRFCELLGISIDDLFAELASREIKNKQNSVEETQHLTDEISKIVTNDSSFLLLQVKAKRKIAVSLSLFGKDNNSQTFARQLVVECAVMCEDETLSQTSELLCASSFICEAIKLCDSSEDYNVSNEETENREMPFEQISGISRFKESANVLSREKLLPMIKTLVVSIQAMRIRRCATSGQMKACTDLIEYLSQNAALQLSLSAIACLNVCLLRPEELDSMQECIVNLAKKSLQSREIDSGLCFGYLASVIDPNASFLQFRNQLPSVHGDYGRLRQLACIGIDLGKLSGVQRIIEDCKQMQLNAHWWNVLSQLEIPFDHRMFTVDLKLGENPKLSEYIFTNILEDLIVKMDFKLNEVFKFTENYNLCSIRVTALYIHMLLLDSRATCVTDYEKRINTLLNAFLTKPADHEDGSRRNENPVAVKEYRYIAQDALSSIDGKDYRRLKFVCEMLLQITPEHKSELTKKMNTLEFLIIDRNMKATGEYEYRTKEVVKNDQTNQTTCQDAIDFHELWANPWAILKSVLTIDSIKRLIGLSYLLNLEPDDFYVYLIKKIQSAGGAENLETFSSLLRQINSANVAVETAEFLAEQYTKACKQKVEMLEFAATLSGKCSDPACESRINRKLNEAATLLDIERYLGAEGLESLSKWVSNPSEMICLAYQQFSHRKPNVHVFTAKIGCQYSIDVAKLRRFMVTKWLAEPRRNQTEGENSDWEFEHEIESRIVDTLSKTTREKNVAFLLGLTFNPKKRTSFRGRKRALGAMFQLASVEAIQSVANRLGKFPDTEEIAKYWQYCGYMTEFEELRLPHTIGQLQSCDKLGLVKALWRDHRDNKVALRLMSILIIDFNLSDNKLVDALKKQLEKFKMHSAFSQIAFMYNH